MREATVLTDANGGVDNAPRGSAASLAAIQPLHVATYVEGADPKGPLFRTIARGRGGLTSAPLPQANAHAMIRLRASDAGF